VENTEKVLVEIRQAMVQCDQAKKKALKDADKAFTDLINTLKERKNELLTEIDQYFNEEKAKVVEEEKRWREKQKICEDLLRLSSKQESDEEILLRSKYIADGLEKLNERQKFNEVKLINSLDTTLHYKDELDHQVDLGSGVLKDLLKQHVQISEYKRLQYKC